MYVRMYICMYVRTLFAGMLHISSVLLYGDCTSLLPVHCRMLAVTIGSMVHKQTGVVCVMVMEALARWLEEHFQSQIGNSVSNRKDVLDLCYAIALW